MYYIAKILFFAACYLSEQIAFQSQSSMVLSDFATDRYVRDPVDGSYQRFVIGSHIGPFDVDYASSDSVGESSHGKAGGQLAKPPSRLHVTVPLNGLRAEDGFDDKFNIKASKVKKRSVTIFLGGMIGLVPIYWYYDAMARLSIAGDGMVVVALDMLTEFPQSYVGVAGVVDKVQQWIEGGHLQDYIERELGVKYALNIDKFNLMSHSSGAQSMIYLWKHKLQNGYRYNSLLLWDPVDAMGEYQDTADVDVQGIELPPPVLDPSNADQFKDHDTPFFIISTGLCHLPSINIKPPKFIRDKLRKWLPPIFDLDKSVVPACCPDKLGPERFYKALSGHQSKLFAGYQEADIKHYGNASDLVLTGHATGYHLNMTHIGHCDVLDDFWSFASNQLKMCRTIIQDRLKTHKWFSPDDPSGDHYGGFEGYKRAHKLSDFRMAFSSSTAAFLDYINADASKKLKSSAKQYLDRLFASDSNVEHETKRESVESRTRSASINN
ncbi:hypothetical protein MP228_000545 [Amoeboaphelidium protococcarum]|nr:hypothetical protein MP228_000545 [Amoeboaphelidium protococcarum]